MQTLLQPYLFIRVFLTSVVMALIFVLDTTTSYEVAAAVFYTVVTLWGGRASSRRGLVLMVLVCIALTLLSFSLTLSGNMRPGLINMVISIAAILMVAYLVVKMESTRTAAHQAQAQLMRVARVKSLEGLTTSIAHEVNQPLAAIATSGAACRRWLSQAPPNLPKALQALDRIMADSARASIIIERVRSLTKGEPPHKAEFDLNDALMEVVALSKAEIERNSIIVEVHLESNLPPALADKVQVQQVVGNLVLNAIEAMASVSKRSRNIRVTSKLRKSSIYVSVTDSGPGISVDQHEHLFEAFWTTKKEGIGVGLSISQAIIEANGGQIWAESIGESGATFFFTVPASEQRLQ